MPDKPEHKKEVDAFLLSRIDSVPHLEALLLLWRGRNESWAPARVAKRLWVTPEVAGRILLDLVREQLLSVSSEGEDVYVYRSEPERDVLIQEVEATYAREMVRVSTMIHSNASSAVREFARAFRFKKEQD